MVELMNRLSPLQFFLVLVVFMDVLDDFISFLAEAVKVDTRSFNCLPGVDEGVDEAEGRKVIVDFVVDNVAFDNTFLFAVLTSFSSRLSFPCPLDAAIGNSILPAEQQETWA